MTALVNALQEILDTQSRRLQTLPIHFPKNHATHEAYIAIKKKLGDGKPVEPLTAQESQFWIAKARIVSAENSWASLSRNDVKNIGKCLCDGEKPLVSDEIFLNGFLKTCDSQARKSLCSVLIWVYLYSYSEERIGILYLGRWLAKSVSQWDWFWADRQIELNLFGDKTAPLRIASKILEETEPVSKQLDSFVEYKNLRSGGMIYEAFSEATKNFRKNSGNQDTRTTLCWLNKFLDWACLDTKTYTYERLKKDFIESLLLPWDNNPPTAEVKTKIQSFLVDQFGDPRLTTMNWNGVAESAQRVIRGWLVERALEQFLDVVDELALDHQWKYRRAFWMAYYKANVISEAWVAFASNGVAKAQEIAKRNKDESWNSCASLHGPGDTDHAVLILRIGDLIITDFSHNGKWRVWDYKNKNAPRPYEKKYHRDDFSSSIEGSHHSSPNGTWQRTVSGIIADKTGINIKGYMP